MDPAFFYLLPEQTMNTRILKFVLPLLLAASVSVQGQTKGLAQGPRRVSFSLDPQSQVYLKGSSTVSPFTCISTQAWSSYQADIQRQGPEQMTIRSQFFLRITALDCGNKGMNADMQEALKADQHPHIGVWVQDVCGPGSLPYAPGPEWRAMVARVSVTVAGTTRNLQIPLQIQRTTLQQVRITGSCPMQMTHFGIEPPTALLGLVKVSDHIDIFFDLIIREERK
jgi:hypothetical protein